MQLFGHSGREKRIIDPIASLPNAKEFVACDTRTLCVSEIVVIRTQPSPFVILTQIVSLRLRTIYKIESLLVTRRHR